VTAKKYLRVMIHDIYTALRSRGLTTTPINECTVRYPAPPHLPHNTHPTLKVMTASMSMYPVMMLSVYSREAMRRDCPDSGLCPLHAQCERNQLFTHSGHEISHSREVGLWRVQLMVRIAHAALTRQHTSGC
jgi:hypothetical protein